MHDVRSHGRRASRPRAAAAPSSLHAAGRVLRYAVQVAVTAVALAAGAVLVVPKALGWQGVLVLTGSMEPALQAGGVAFVDRIEPKDIEVGDIMTFTRPDSAQQVTHRVTGVIPTGAGYRFTTKGDANDIPDDWIVNERQVVGKVRFALPHLAGAVGLLVGNRQLLALLMAVPAAYLIYDDVKRSRAKRRAEQEALAVPVATTIPGRRRTRPVPASAVVAGRERRPRPLRAEPLPEPEASSAPAHGVAVPVAAGMTRHRR